jgi:hypothetical protein
VLWGYFANHKRFGVAGLTLRLESAARRRGASLHYPRMDYLTDWRILLAFLLLAIAVMVYRSQKR